MSELMFVLISGGVSLITQFVKKHIPSVNPLFIVAIISLFGAGIWGIFSKIASEAMFAYITLMWGFAVVIFNVVKEVVKK